MPMPALHTASSVILLALVAGCATLDKDECLRADWYAIGLEDLSREAEQLEQRIAALERR